MSSLDFKRLLCLDFKCFFAWSLASFFGFQKSSLHGFQNPSLLAWFQNRIQKGDSKRWSKGGSKRKSKGGSIKFYSAKTENHCWMGKYYLCKLYILYSCEQKRVLLFRKPDSLFFKNSNTNMPHIFLKSKTFLFVKIEKFWR